MRRRCLLRRGACSDKHFYGWRGFAMPEPEMAALKGFEWMLADREAWKRAFGEESFPPGDTADRDLMNARRRWRGHNLPKGYSLRMNDTPPYSSDLKRKKWQDAIAYEQQLLQRPFLTKKEQVAAISRRGIWTEYDMLTLIERELVELDAQFDYRYEIAWKQRKVITRWIKQVEADLVRLKQLTYEIKGGGGPPARKALAAMTVARVVEAPWGCTLWDMSRKLLPVLEEAIIERPKEGWQARREPAVAVRKAFLRYWKQDNNAVTRAELVEGVREALREVYPAAYAVVQPTYEEEARLRAEQGLPEEDEEEEEEEDEDSDEELEEWPLVAQAGMRSLETKEVDDGAVLDDDEDVEPEVDEDAILEDPYASDEDDNKEEKERKRRRRRRRALLEKPPTAIQIATNYFQTGDYEAAYQTAQSVTRSHLTDMMSGLHDPDGLAETWELNQVAHNRVRRAQIAVHRSKANPLMDRDYFGYEPGEWLRPTRADDEEQQVEQNLDWQDEQRDAAEKARQQFWRSPDFPVTVNMLEDDAYMDERTELIPGYRKPSAWTERDWNLLLMMHNPGRGRYGSGLSLEYDQNTGELLSDGTNARYRNIYKVTEGRGIWNLGKMMENDGDTPIDMHPLEEQPALDRYVPYDMFPYCFDMPEGFDPDLHEVAPVQAAEYLLSLPDTGTLDHDWRLDKAHELSNLWWSKTAPSPDDDMVTEHLAGREYTHTFDWPSTGNYLWSFEDKEFIADYFNGTGYQAAETLAPDGVSIQRYALLPEGEVAFEGEEEEDDEYDEDEDEDEDEAFDDDDDDDTGGFEDLDIDLLAAGSSGDEDEDAEEEADEDEDEAGWDEETMALAQAEAGAEGQQIDEYALWYNSGDEDDDAIDIETASYEEVRLWQDRLFTVNFGPSTWLIDTFEEQPRRSASLVHEPEFNDWNVDWFPKSLDLGLSRDELVKLRYKLDDCRIKYADYVAWKRVLDVRIEVGLCGEDGKNYFPYIAGKRDTFERWALYGARTAEKLRWLAAATEDARKRVRLAELLAERGIPPLDRYTMPPSYAFRRMTETTVDAAMRIGQWAAAADVSRRRDTNIWRRRAGLDEIDPLPAFPLGEDVLRKMEAENKRAMAIAAFEELDAAALASLGAEERAAYDQLRADVLAERADDAARAARAAQAGEDDDDEDEEYADAEEELEEEGEADAVDSADVTSEAAFASADEEGADEEAEAEEEEEEEEGAESRPVGRRYEYLDSVDSFLFLRHIAEGRPASSFEPVYGAQPLRVKLMRIRLRMLPGKQAPGDGTHQAAFEAISDALVGTRGLLITSKQLDVLRLQHMQEQAVLMQEKQARADIANRREERRRRRRDIYIAAMRRRYDALHPPRDADEEGEEREEGEEDEDELDDASAEMDFDEFVAEYEAGDFNENEEEFEEDGLELLDDEDEMDEAADDENEMDEMDEAEEEFEEETEAEEEFEEEEFEELEGEELEGEAEAAAAGSDDDDDPDDPDADEEHEELYLPDSDDDSDEEEYDEDDEGEEGYDYASESSSSSDEDEDMDEQEVDEVAWAARREHEFDMAARVEMVSQGLDDPDEDWEETQAEAATATAAASPDSVADAADASEEAEEEPEEEDPMYEPSARPILDLRSRRPNHEPFDAQWDEIGAELLVPDRGDLLAHFEAIAAVLSSAGWRATMLTLQRAMREQVMDATEAPAWLDGRPGQVLDEDDEERGERLDAEFEKRKDDWPVAPPRDIYNAWADATRPYLTFRGLPTGIRETKQLSLAYRAKQDFPRATPPQAMLEAMAGQRAGPDKDPEVAAAYHEYKAAMREAQQKVLQGWDAEVKRLLKVQAARRSNRWSPFNPFGELSSDPADSMLPEEDENAETLWELLTLDPEELADTLRETFAGDAGGSASYYGGSDDEDDDEFGDEAVSADDVFAAPRAARGTAPPRFRTGKTRADEEAVEQMGQEEFDDLPDLGDTDF